jgi:hypothetical protein
MLKKIENKKKLELKHVLPLRCEKAQRGKK